MSPVRFARIVSRLLWAFTAGLCVRLARRLLGQKPRIWHGPVPLHSTRYNVEADRHGGYQSRSVTIHTKPLAYDLVTHRDFDIVIDERVSPWNERHWIALADLFRHGDIWSAYFDSLFFPHANGRKNALTLRVIRLCGIRIVVTSHGSDIVQVLRQKTRYDWVGRFQHDYPDWDFAQQTPVSKGRVAAFLNYADLIIAPDSATRRLLPRADLLFKCFPIDCAELRPVTPITQRATPLIVHAPNHRYVKGTDFLLAAVERLRTHGFTFELRLVERVARDEALTIYRDADIIADQFCIGAFGVFALEGLALGKPVLTYLDQEHLGDPVFNLPIINATPENLSEILAALIAVPELRQRIGNASRESVEQYQSIQAMADVWGEIYRSIWTGTPLALDRTAHFSARRTTRSFSEDPSVAEFWPVSVEDLLPEITAAIMRLRAE